MAEGDEKKSTVIIVKKKGGHAGAHGGAWKVAYADFVTAMMAFFLLMWLLNSVSKEQKEALADFFQNFSVFDQPGKTIMRREGPPKNKSEAGKANKKLGLKQLGVVDLNPETLAGMKNIPFESYGRLTPKEFVDKLQETIEARLADIKNQIKIDITEDGVRIQLVDRDGKDMFPAASAVPSVDCKRALRVLADSFREMPNPVAIDGHTDATGQNDGQNGNWKLSTMRALAAREHLEEDGVDADQFRRVTGRADTDPLRPEDPESSVNRRVAITVLFAQAGVRENRPDGPRPLTPEESGELPTQPAPEPPPPGSGTR